MLLLFYNNYTCVKYPTTNKKNTQFKFVVVTKDIISDDIEMICVFRNHYVRNDKMTFSCKH